MAKRNTKKRDVTKVRAIIMVVLGALILGVPQIVSIAIGLYLLVTGILSLVDKK